jgi:hypothetical protein
MTKTKILSTLVFVCAVLGGLAILLVPSVYAAGIGTGVLPIGGSPCVMSYMTFPIIIGTCGPISGGVVSA